MNLKTLIRSCVGGKRPFGDSWGKQYRLDIDEIKELLIFLGVTMGLWFAGECSYSEKAHTEVFRGEVS